MSSFKNLKQFFGLFVTVLILTIASLGAMAAGTASGTDVANFATVNYEMGSIAEIAINSPNVTFVVDTQIDLTVDTTDVAAVASTPSSNDNVMTFTVTNTGNASQDFSLSAVALVWMARAHR